MMKGGHGQNNMYVYVCVCMGEEVSKVISNQVMVR